MASSAVPAPLPQSSNNLVCDVCDLKFVSQEVIDIHYYKPEHWRRVTCLAGRLFGYAPDKLIKCLDDLFNHPKKKGVFIGMHYVTERSTRGEKRGFSCTLCNVTCDVMFHHIASMAHKSKYIEKDFPFLISNRETTPSKVIEQIATIIEKAEGLQKFKVAMKKHTKNSSSSDCSSGQTLDEIVEQLKIHGIAFNYPSVKEKDEICLAMKAPSSRRIRRGFKQGKLKQKTQPVGKPIMSLSRSVPLPFSDPSVGVPAGKNSQQATKRSSTSDIHQIKDMASKRVPSLFSIDSQRWAYQTTCPPAEEYFPSMPPPPSQSIYRTAEHRSGYSNQSLSGFANNSAHGQASPVSDIGKAYAFEGPTWGQETGHPGAQHLHTLGTMGCSISSLTAPTSVNSLKHTTSRYGYNSVDVKELPSKSSSPLGITSVLNKEPILPKSHLDSPSNEGTPPATTSTGTRVQTSQGTNSDMPVKAASMLSPHTLKILQGREPESVKNILKRLSEYCPELQQVNISLLVDVLFETGALH